MKILICTDSFLPQINGVSTSIYTLVKELSKQGHKILIFSPKFEPKESVKIPNVSIVRLPSIPARIYPDMYFGTFSPQTVRSVRDFHPDIVHIMSPGTIGIQGLALAKTLKYPVVSTFHGYFMEPEYLEIVHITLGQAYVARFLWSFARSFFNATDAIICPTAFVKKDLIKHKFTSPLHVCSNGVEIDTKMKRKQDLQEFIEHYGLDPKKTAIYVGRLSVEKSMEELIECFATVSEQLTEAKLLIIGDGPQLPQLSALVVEKKLSGKVIFTGAIEHSEILEKGIFLAGSVFVSCSRSEVQPMSMIEATTFGLPLIVYKARGAGDMVDQNGYAIRTGDKKAFSRAMSKVLSNESTQSQMSARALEVAKRYYVSASTEEVLGVYSSVLSKTTKV